MKYFCETCSNNPLVPKAVGINPETVVKNCMHCGAEL